MATAALIEHKRRNSPSKLSILWISPQYLIFGLSEMFTAVGLIEFFYKQSVQGMLSFLTAMTYCPYSFGFYLSSLLVSLVNRVCSGEEDMVGWGEMTSTGTGWTFSTGCWLHSASSTSSFTSFGRVGILAIHHCLLRSSKV
ncbi:major facilitator superfamily protein [Striga asiatica]|uniref:Major facilitator superfamily protein n=1 Tax=Striga asiatica TaxID=4170 RepID=A0A5A7QR20_STRAF|nr:major facilitator superfamily protein [Striga asiatica]